jgi:hypothetical protein
MKEGIFMILNQTVILKWHPRNKDRYENLGYIYTKIGQEFEVKIEDLSKGSPVKIQAKCDCENCKEPNIIKNISYNNYNMFLHEDGKYYCQQCGTNVFGREKANRTILKKSKSFEQWCTENNRQDILDRWDYELNDYKPSEITYSANKKYWFKCPKGIHNSELKNINSFTYRKNGNINCNQCNSFAQWGIDNFGDDFLKEYWSNKNTLNPWDISHSCNKKVFIKCQEKDYHEDYQIRCADFIVGQRCPYCATFHGKVHPKDSLGQYIIDNFGQDFLGKIWSNKNKKSPFEYTLYTEQIVWWRCFDKKHDDFKRKICISYMTDFRCPDCVKERKESIIQEKVRVYLEEMGFTILHEYNCTIIPQNPKIKNKRGRLPFDNEIKELKLVIEVHGIQHYEINSWHKKLARKNNTTPEQEIHYQQLKDRYKRIKAIQQGYSYLEIPYWTFDKEDVWKQSINNKINFIKKKGMI